MSLKKLTALAEKKKKYVVGLMSGTSLDGVDAALVEIKNSGTNIKINLIDFISSPFPDDLPKTILKNSLPGCGNVTDICRLNFLIPHIYFDAVKKLLKKAKFPIEKVDLIGTHGQTIHHLPAKEKYFGHIFGSTLQIGDPAVLAKISNIITVGDFRTGDIALEGEGAPLIPYFDYLIFRSKEKSRALLNIGGISNFTILPKNCTVDDVAAFDTGPGNMLTDFLAKKFLSANYDKGGAAALSGNICKPLFDELILNDKYIISSPPKSTGREYYNEEYLSKYLKKFSSIPFNDFLATVSLLTPFAIYKNFELFVRDKTPVDELIISGGGAKNRFFTNNLKKYFGKNTKIKNINGFGMPSDAKEAVCFAVLANETISGNATNIPAVTGAIKKTILGKICLP